MLTEEGYDVVGQAGDGQRAIELAEELRPDLVILDVKMPVLDGIAAAEQIAGRRIAPVVMLTAFSQRELVERARDAGAMAYLVKPFSQSDLVPAIEMALSRFAELTLLESEVADLHRAPRDPQGRRAGQGRAAGPAEALRARRLPLDPEDRDGPAALDAPGRRRASTSTARASRRAEPGRRIAPERRPTMWVRSRIDNDAAPSRFLCPRTPGRSPLGCGPSRVDTSGSAGPRR